MGEHDEVAGVDVEVNLGEYALKLGADLSKSMSTLNDKAQQIFARMQNFTPVKFKMTQSVVVNAGGTAYVELGTPQNGFWWAVENVVIGGADQSTVVGGSAGLYVTSQSNGVSPGMADMVDQAKTLPNVAFYGRRDIVVLEREKLTVGVFGGTSGNVILIAATVTVYNVAAGLGKISQGEN